MKKVLALLLLLAITSPASADSDTAANPPSSTGTGHGRGSKGLKGNKKSASQGNNTIHGHCTLLESPMNPLSGPCVSVPLVLKDAKENELGSARTDSKGDFVFAVDPDLSGPFWITSSSHFYDNVGGKEPVKIGQPVDLKIREKN